MANGEIQQQEGLQEGEEGRKGWSQRRKGKEGGKKSLTAFLGPESRSSTELEA